MKEFKYLGSYLTEDGGIKRELITKVVLALDSFQQLMVIWESREISTTNKLKLYKSNVRSVLL